MKPSPGQMQLLDLAPASQAETAESLAAQHEERGPAAAGFAVDSLVRCVKPTSSGRLPWGGRQGVVNRIAGDRIYVQYDQWPPYPHRLGDLTWVGEVIL